MKIKKSDIVLILVVVCVAASCLLLYMRFGRESAGKVVVTVDGKVKGTYSLSDNTEVQINDTNTFVIVRIRFAYIIKQFRKTKRRLFVCRIKW